MHFGIPGTAIAELVRLPMDMSRRFQLAAAKTRTMGLVVRRWRRQTKATDYGNPTAAATRWRVSALPSEPSPVEGVGRPRWMLELIRQRAGEAFDIEVNACDQRGWMSAVYDEWVDKSFDERRASGNWWVNAISFGRACIHPDCPKWGSYGLERPRLGPAYWCKEHLPAD